MKILEDLSSELKDISEADLGTVFLTGISIKLEEYSKIIKEENKPETFIQIAANLTNVFDGYLLSTLEPGAPGLDLIKESLELQNQSYNEIDPEKENKLNEVNNKLRLLADGKDITKDLSEQEEETDEKEDSAPDENLPMEYDIPVASEDDSLSYVEFVNESTEHIESIENKILDLESSPEDKELINDIFRPFHSMKGAAGFLGLVDINKLSHEAENLLDLARKDKIRIGMDAVNALLESLDIIKQLLTITTMRVDQKLGKLPQDQKIVGVPIGQIQKKLLEVASKPMLAAGETGVESAEGSKLGEILVQKGEITRDQFEDALNTQKKRIGEILVEKGAISPDKVQEALQVQQQKAKKVSPPLKVDTEKLDNLMELVGELVIAQTLVGQDEILQTDANQNISKNITNLGKITKTLQEQVMAIRMVPIKQTFVKMNRLVRDVAQKTNKKVELRLSGVDTEIDKTVVDELGDPLIHLLRNSVDHGIELPEVRKEAGKNETGIVELNAYHQGGSVVIEVIDNGKGLSRDKLYKKALDKNLIEKDKNYSDLEIFNFILLPGFSTVEVASDISGRGVGMDVVSRNIKKLGGKLEIYSKEGKGSTFTIKLPLTMSIVDGMVVIVGAQRYVIPTISILESIRPSKKNMVTVKKEGELINVRGNLYPLIRLHKLFGVNPLHNNPCDALVVLIESNGKIKGVMVDDLQEQQQVVIKNLGKMFRSVTEISGGAILGDGRVGLILDAEGIVRASC